MPKYNSWISPKEMFTKQQKHKLSKEIVATNICVEAEKMFPGLFRAVSVKNNILHLELKMQDMMNFKMIEGKLLTDINTYSKSNSLGLIEQIRLTISDD